MNNLFQPIPKISKHHNQPPLQITRIFSFKNNECDQQFIRGQENEKEQIQMVDNSNEISSIQKQDDDINVSFQEKEQIASFGIEQLVYNTDFQSNIFEKEILSQNQENHAKKSQSPLVSCFVDKKSDLSEITQLTLSQINISPKIQRKNILNSFQDYQRNFLVKCPTDLNSQIKLIIRSLECEKFLLKHVIQEFSQNPIQINEYQQKCYRTYFCQKNKQRPSQFKKDDLKFINQSISYYKINILTLNLTLKEQPEEENVVFQENMYNDNFIEKIKNLNEKQNSMVDKKKEISKKIDSVQPINLDFSKLFQKVDQEVLQKYYQNEQFYQQQQFQQKQFFPIQNPQSVPQQQQFQQGQVMFNDFQQKNFQNNIFNQGFMNNQSNSFPLMQQNLQMQNKTQSQSLGMETSAKQTKVYNTRSGQH